MFQRLLGDTTLVEGVRRLTPGTVVEFDMESRRCRTRKYWCAEREVFKRLPLNRSRVAAIADSFQRGLSRRLSGAGRVGLSLSGGLDSRAIAAVLGREGVSVLSYTTGINNCIDQKLAEQIAPLIRSQHKFYCVTQLMIRQYPRAIQRAAFLSDGVIVEGGFPAGFTDRFCLEYEVQTLFRGHGGENAKLHKAFPFAVDKLALELPRANLFEDVYKRLLKAPTFLDWNRLFPNPQFKVTRDEAIQGIKGVLDEFDPDLTSAEVLSLLYLTQNDGIMVPRTRNGLRGLAEMALPFLDYEFMDCVLATDVRCRLGTDIHQQIVKDNFPMLMRIANSNTGAPLDASPLRVAMADKLNSLFRRLRIPGYRHYHYMEQWIRDTLASQMRAIILDPRSASRGLFDPKYVREILDRAALDASLSRLVDLFVNIEVWCRLFLDGEGLDSSVSELITLQ
jgi:asparagine synthase (glutamine-hydrolysing)